MLDCGLCAMAVNNEGEVGREYCVSIKNKIVSS